MVQGFINPSNFFSAIQSYCSGLLVGLLPYDGRSTLLRLNRRKNMYGKLVWGHKMVSVSGFKICPGERTIVSMTAAYVGYLLLLLLCSAVVLYQYFLSMNLKSCTFVQRCWLKKKLSGSLLDRRLDFSTRKNHLENRF